MPRLDEAAMKEMKKQMGDISQEDFSPIEADVAVESKDGEPVGMILVGYAKGGKLTNTEAVDFDMSMTPGRKGLANKLSQKKDS